MWPSGCAIPAQFGDGISEHPKLLLIAMQVFRLFRSVGFSADQAPREDVGSDMAEPPAHTGNYLDNRQLANAYICNGN
jgi:hypothetical protein